MPATSLQDVHSMLSLECGVQKLKSIFPYEKFKSIESITEAKDWPPIVEFFRIVKNKGT